MRIITGISRALTLVLLTVAAVGDRAIAQDATTQIAIAGGVATDQRGARSNALTVAPSFSFAPSNLVSFQLGGNATRFASEAFSLGAGGSVSAQEPIGRFAALTLTASGNASRLESGSKATFAQADIVPALELRLSRVAVFGGVRAGTGVVREDVQQPGLPFAATRTNTMSTSRTGLGPVYGGVLAFGDNEKLLRLGIREERLRVAGVTSPERTISASLSLALTPVASLDLAAGRYDSNRLIGTPSGEYVSAGISFRFGGAREPSMPSVRGARPQSAGTTRLSIRAPDAQRVEIAGDFNEWTPRAATRAANGVWYADLTIPAGQYRYAFRVNGIEWRVPDGATAVDDGFGGKSAWLTISDARSR